MSYSLRIIYSRFISEVSELSSIVISLQNEQQSIARDTHIEGCFIRFVVCWEGFLEDYFLRCLCNATTRSNRTISPQRTTSRNIKDAFKRINKNRRDRDKDFIDWLDVKLVQQRIDDDFRANSRVQKICESPDKLYELRIIRNAIAHRSVSAVTKFKKFVKDQMGYLAVLDPTMASLLIQKKRNTRDIIFTIMTDYFIQLAEKLTK